MKTNEENNSTRLLALWTVTKIDPATGQFEIRQIHDQEPGTVINTAEQAWLSMYSWTAVIV